MENIQINGQKIWGPPRDWSGPPPPHGTEIYIKNLPDNVNEIELFQIFSIIGRVYEVRLPVHWSGVNRGYAFVRFTKISEADLAIKYFEGFEIRGGRTIKIERSVDNTRLFLSCVPNCKSSDEIKKDLETVVDNVEKVYVYPTLENPSLYRGYAFVEFKSHRDAAIAKRILTPDVCLNLFENKCVAAWANPLPFLNENVLKTINTLFMRNVPKELKNTTVKKALENLLGVNTIQKVKRLNDFAFLTFKNHDSAKTALNIIKRHPGLFGANKVQIEWAVPREPNNVTHASPEDCENRRLNNELPKHNRSFLAQSTGEVESNDLFHTDENELRLFNCHSSDSQKRMDALEENDSGKEIRYQKLWKELRLKSCQTEYLQWKNIKITSPKKESNAITGNSSFHALKDMYPSSVSVSPMEGSDGTWNLTPNSDLESEEPFRSPQTKHWFENVFRSPSPSSPTFTGSSTESSIFWQFNECNSPSHYLGSSNKLSSNMEKLSLNCNESSKENIKNKSLVAYPRL